MSYKILFFVMLTTFWSIMSMEEEVTLCPLIAKKVIKRWNNKHPQIILGLQKRAQESADYVADFHIEGVLVATYYYQQKSITTYFKNNESCELSLQVLEEILKNKDYYLPQKNGQKSSKWCWLF